MREFDLNHDFSAEHEVMRGNSRRLKVFLSVFLAVLVAGMLWNFMRHDEYLATARMRIAPGTNMPRDVVPAAGIAHSPVQEAAFLTQVQVLTGRPLLHAVAQRLEQAGFTLAEDAGNPAEALQAMISATPVEGTQVVELRAVAGKPDLTAAVLNGLMEAYGKQSVAAFGNAEAENLAQVREEVGRLAESATDKREQIEAFRATTGIVSAEREENLALSSLKGLNNSLNNAVERSVTADARLAAIREGGALGRKRGGAKDDPTLASMEQRVSALREELREMERSYTPAFMDLDPHAKALQARVAELESQISSQRAAGRSSALNDAEEEAASARAAVERLHAQIAATKHSAREAAARFAQAKSLDDDLAQVEQAHREALARLARIEASERSRHPVLELVEAASVPGAPFRPDRLRDGSFVLAAAFMLGVLAMWFVELFNRRPAPSAGGRTFVVPQPWLATGPGLSQLNMNGVAGALPHEFIQTEPTALLSHTLPERELTQSEVSALLHAATGATRFACAALLMGVGLDELLALRQSDFDRARMSLSIGGANPRQVTLPAWCADAIDAEGDGPLLHDATGGALTPEDMKSMLICAALDAGLDDATALNTDVLRHTCIAWLVRQGVRFSDLAGRVGRISADALIGYSGLTPIREGMEEAEICWIMPALGDDAAT